MLLIPKINKKKNYNNYAQFKPRLVTDTPFL